MNRAPIALLMLALAAPLATAGRANGSAFTDAATLKQFEDTYERFLKDDPAARRTDEHNARVAAYNHAVSEANRIQTSGQADLQQASEAVTALRAKIDRADQELKQKPDAQDAGAVESYNKKVVEYNRQADQYKKVADEYNQKVLRFQAECDARSRDLQARKSKLDTEEAQDEQANHEVEEWFRQHQDVAYGRAFMEFYAGLRQEAQGGPPGSGAGALLTRARSLRRELGEYAVHKESQGNPGVLIEKVEIGDEECYLVLDTGAAKVSVSPELVGALGLTNALGQEEETTVAGGMTAKGRQLTLPSVRVGNAEATNVSAIQVPLSMLGVDGLLGRSFLSQFVLTVDDGADPKVNLKKR